MIALIDPITLRPIPAADLLTEIAMLERLIADSRNEFVERVLLEVLWQRTHRLAAMQTVNHVDQR